MKLGNVDQLTGAEVVFIRELGVQELVLGLLKMIINKKKHFEILHNTE